MRSPPKKYWHMTLRQLNTIIDNPSSTKWEKRCAREMFFIQMDDFS